MADLRFYQVEYDQFYKKGIEAYQAGDLDSAKRNLALAAKAMLKMAEGSEGQLKAERIKKAKEVAAAAAKLDAQSRKQKKVLSDGSVESKKSGAGDNQNDEDSKYLTKWEPVEKTGVRLDDVAGLQEAKKELFEKVINPQRHPEIYAKYKKNAGGGILLYGLPGTGKTMFAQAVATELNAAFFNVKCSDIASRYFGDSERNIRGLFDAARKYPYSIIFFDEFEALGSKRDSKSTVMKRLIPQLLTEIQGFEKSDSKILVLAATNRPWDLDSAFLRPGRFDTHIHVPLPDKDARLAIAQKAFEGVPVAPDFSLEEIALKTAGFNGADVKSFCDKAKDPAINRETSGSGGEPYVTNADVEETALYVHSTVQLEDRERLEKFEESKGGI